MLKMSPRRESHLSNFGWSWRRKLSLVVWMLIVDAGLGDDDSVVVWMLIDDAKNGCLVSTPPNYLLP